MTSGNEAVPLRAVCVLGPTGTGKTAAALALARSGAILPGPVTVINFDSRQIYEDFPIITAQPSPEERAVCPHKLYGILPATETISAAGFVELAEAEIDRVLVDGGLPVLVGGTGLYLRALVRGLADIPDISPEIREQVQARIAAEGAPALHKELTEVDPEYAASVHPNNRQRVGRALEVFLGTGKPFSRWHAEQDKGDENRYLKLGAGMGLDKLTPRLALRIDLMLENGALDEARAALEKCPDTAAPGWTGIGCAELAAHLHGDLSLEEAKVLWLKNTRAYAKRQITWFRKEPGIHWLESGEEEKLTEFVLETVTTVGLEYP